MTVSRLASLVVAAAYLVAAGVVVPRNGPGLISCVFATLLPLPFIWFPDALGGYTGPAHLGSVARPTPGLAIAVAGWVWLAALPAILLAVYA